MTYRAHMDDLTPRLDEVLKAESKDARERPKYTKGWNIFKLMLQHKLRYQTKYVNFARIIDEEQAGRRRPGPVRPVVEAQMYAWFKAANIHLGFGEAELNSAEANDDAWSTSELLVPE